MYYKWFGEPHPFVSRKRITYRTEWRRDTWVKKKDQLESDTDIVSRLQQSDRNECHVLFVTKDYPSIMEGHIECNIQHNKQLSTLIT
jgi:hypothetical protein